jgi:uncharacterized protein (TIRG00374 family)
MGFGGREKSLMKKFHIGSILLGVLLFVLLIWKIGIEELWRDFTLLGWGLGPFILMEGIVTIFHTLAWRYCLAPAHRSLSFLRLLGINLAGNSINYFTPTATLGGEITRGVLLSGDRQGTEAAMGVIIGKLSFALSQIIFIVLGSAFFLWRINLPATAAIAMFAGTALLGVGIVGFLVVQKNGKLGTVVRWLVVHHLGGNAMQKAAQHITQVDQALKLFYQERPWDLPLSLLWRFVAMICGIVKTWYFLLVLANGSIVEAAGIFLLGTWFDLITFAIPLGIGIQEGSRVLAFKVLGFPLSLGLTYGIALRLEQIFWAGVGLFIYAGLLAGKREKGSLLRNGVRDDQP